jgi:hypothetical protein
MIKINVSADSDFLRQLARRLPGMFGEGVAPATKAAFDDAAGMIRKMWQDWAMGGPIAGISNIKNPNSALAASIQPHENGPFDVSIETASPYARRIQEGTPELDMKTTHPYGKKSRVTKSGPNKGIPYLIVPIRWGTPNSKGGKRAHMGNVIPQAFAARVKAFRTYNKLAITDKKGTIIGGEMYFENNYSGQAIARSGHNADYDRLDDVEGNARGMVRTGGGGGYFTFRIISAAQLVTRPFAWIRKAVAPVDVVGALERTTGPLAEDLIQAGLEADFGI